MVTIYMKYRILFSGESEKNIVNLPSAEFVQIVVKVKWSGSLSFAYIDCVRSFYIVTSLQQPPLQGLLNMTCPVVSNSVDPDQLASELIWICTVCHYIRGLCKKFCH